MLARVRSHLRSNVIAYVALFLALSGTAFAARAGITGDQIQDESLTGADVLNDSLKGDDVDESSLNSKAFQIAGAIKGDGTVARGSGFTAFRNVTGLYTVTFPAGTFGCVNDSSDIVMVVSPDTGSRTAETQPLRCSEGSITRVAITTKDLNANLADAAFSFIAVGD